MFYKIVDTALGKLLIAEEDGYIRLINFQNGDRVRTIENEWKRITTELIREACSQLTAYLNGDLRIFDLPIEPGGTEFQRSVWKQVVRIPYGQTRSYQNIAATLNKPRAARAVGNANGANPIPLIIPCHRVIGANGNLTGYAGGLILKKKLLAIEK